MDVVEVGVVKQWEEQVIDSMPRRVDGGVAVIVDHIGYHEYLVRESRGTDVSGKVVEMRSTGREETETTESQYKVRLRLCT